MTLDITNQSAQSLGTSVFKSGLQRGVKTKRTVAGSQAFSLAALATLWLNCQYQDYRQSPLEQPEPEV